MAVIEQHQGAWYVLIGAAQRGPFSTAQVRELVVGGNVDGSSYVWREGYREWVQLRAVPELARDPPKAADASDRVEVGDEAPLVQPPAPGRWRAVAFIDRISTIQQLSSMSREDYQRAISDDINEGLTLSLDCLTEKLEGMRHVVAALDRLRGRFASLGGLLPVELWQEMRRTLVDDLTRQLLRQFLPHAREMLGELSGTLGAERWAGAVRQIERLADDPGWLDAFDLTLIRGAQQGRDANRRVAAAVAPAAAPSQPAPAMKAQRVESASPAPAVEVDRFSKVEID